MDTGEIDKVLLEEEGKRLKVYLDSEGYPTVGIGHLVREYDKLKVGDTISEERCQQLYDRDLSVAIEDARKVAKDLDSLPVPIQTVLVCMSFQLGLVRLAAFTHMVIELRTKNWKGVAREMADSKWARHDCPERARRMIAMVEGCIA